MGIAVLCLGLAGCGGQAGLLPVTGTAGGLQVQEYPLVERSADNPNHVAFQQRVPAAVAARRSGWHFPGPNDAIGAQNDVLAPFGYRLQASATPPFSEYSLLYNGNVLYNNISHFWPVSVKGGGEDFLLAFETMAGERLVASSAGVQPWPGGGQAADSAPVFYGDQIAFAESVGSEVSVYAGSSKLYSAAAAAPETIQVDSLRSWARDHWAMDLGGKVVLDGQDLNKSKGYDQSFFLQIINGEPLYFYTRGGQTHINYAGRDLAYSYDQVIHGNQGELAIFNPGSNGRVVWFYALRDGLWYYVEVGLFD